MATIGKALSLSVVMPLYNKAHTVAATLASVLAQSVKDYELIVVDDGSRDGGDRIVESAQDSRVRLVRQANAGVSVARNIGIEAARGEWIALIDADDLWAPDHLAGLVEAARQHEIVAVFSNFRLQSRAFRPSIDPGLAAQRVDDYFAFALSHGGYPLSPSAVLIRRDQLVAAGLFAIGVWMGEDIDLWCRLACRGSFFYNARPSATYNDLPTHSGVVGDLSRKAAFPHFAGRLPEMIARGETPARLIATAKRYANFLLLEYARQLLDRGQYAEARGVLLQHCRPALDLKRFAKRLARTTPVGRRLYEMQRSLNMSRRAAA